VFSLLQVVQALYWSSPFSAYSMHENDGIAS